MGGITDILIIGMVGLGAVYILKNPQILQAIAPAPATAQVQCADGTLVATAEECPATEEVPAEEPVPAASQIQCADGTVIASTETCPDVAGDTPEEEDEDDEDEDNDDNDDNKNENPKSSVKTQTKAQRDATTKNVNEITKAHAKKTGTPLAKGFYGRIDEDDYTPLNWG